MRRGLGWLVAAAAVGWLVARRARVFAVAVEGRSMEPTLRPGDFLLVVGRPRRIARGDVVVVRRPEREVVKRVAAVPGDRVGDRPLGPGELLVVGDNPSASTDGREFGPVSREAIAGVVRFRYWPRPGPVT